ncbi:hypothetical protein FIBSPDRAFT_865091 [Athelia psychrophila]|uniref:Uncharacterized protein n=1 Tax=Athelia psychrophila TaxID=1759441 RepID=A0A166G3M8_9AGAM|nr:hypothetical protein FIBSPDRAFT_865091 [Fibularhizoctonia sp. CBS 109695]
MAHPATALPIPKWLSMPPPVFPSPALSRPTERVNSPPKPPSPVISPLQPAAKSEPAPQSQHAAHSRVGALQTTHNAPPSHTRESATSKSEYGIWSRRPHVPASAPRMITAERCP